MKIKPLRKDLPIARVLEIARSDSVETNNSKHLSLLIKLIFCYKHLCKMYLIKHKLTYGRRIIKKNYN